MTPRRDHPERRPGRRRAARRQQGRRHRRRRHLHGLSPALGPRAGADRDRPRRLRAGDRRRAAQAAHRRDRPRHRDAVRRRRRRRAARPTGPASERRRAGEASAVVLAADSTRRPHHASNVERVLRMDGHDVPAAVTRMIESTVAAVARAGLEVDDLDLFVTHQANARIIRPSASGSASSREGRPRLRSRLANTSTASIPLALSLRARTGACSPGQHVAVAAFGARLRLGRGRHRMEGARECLRREAIGARHRRHRGIGAAIAEPLRPTAGRRGQLPLRRGRRQGHRRRDRAGRRRAAAVHARRDRRPPDELFRRVEDALGPVLVLVNNAGVTATA